MNISTKIWKIKLGGKCRCKKYIKFTGVINGQDVNGIKSIVDERTKIRCLDLA